MTWSRKSISVVLHDENYRQIPHGRDVNSLMKISFASSPITIKNDCNFFFLFQFAGQCNSNGHAILGSQVRDHSYNMMFVRTKMERSISAFCIAHQRALPLSKQSFKRHFSACKDAQIPMHRQNVFILVQGLRYSHSNGFLSNSTKPFTDLILPK